MSVLVPPAHLIGNDVEVPCADGLARRYVNLDYAASTPVMSAVWDVVEAFVPFYTQRPPRHRRQVADLDRRLREGPRGRRPVRRARLTASVVFVRNTTEAVNVLANALAAGARVLSTPVEHHANMLPWRKHDLRMLPFTTSADELLEVTARRPAPERIDLLAVTGASNVTGEVWPLAQLAALAHEHGAQLFVDAAQLAPHRAIAMADAGIDHLALSGHKLYAPFGAGALVSRDAAGRRPAAARRRRDQARDARRRDLGRGARPLRGGLAERDRRGRLRRRLRGARADRHGRRSPTASARSRPACTPAWTPSPA